MDNSQLPAYPLPSGLVVEEGNVCIGITKLEAFTMAAMQGLCSMENKSDQVFHSIEDAYASVAKIAVGIAHATLAELSKHQ